MTPKNRRRPLFWLIVMLVFLYLLCPFYWALISSLKTPEELVRTPATLWPQEPTLQNYLIVLSDEALMRGLWNSSIVALAVVLFSLLVGSFAAYALARFRFRGKQIWLYVILSMSVFPAVSIIVPLYGIIRRLQLDAMIGMSLTYLIFTLPLAIWLLTAYFRTIPTDLLEAATVDGATPLQVMYKILLPLATPALVSVGLLTFITAWNEYLFALTFTTTQVADRTVPVAIASYNAVGPTFGPMMAANVVVMAPILALIIIFQERLTAGLTGTLALKSEPQGALGEWGGAGWWPMLLALAFAALLLLQARSLLFGLAYVERTLTFPYQVDYGEGPLLDQAVRLARGETIYRPDLDEPPYTIANYPPLYVAVQSLFASRYGPAFWYGRATSFLSILATSLLVALTIHTLTRDRRASLIGGLTFLVIPYVGHWAPLFRIDGLALALSWGGLFLIVRWPTRRWSLLATMLLLIAAIYTRQSYALAAPLTAVAWLLVRGEWRRALTLAGGVGGLSLVLLLWLTLLTRGGFFFHVVTANVNEFVWAEVGEYAVEVGRYMPILLLGNLLALALAWRARRQGGVLLGAYLLGSLGAAFTVGKVGSNVNYLLELCAALALGTGLLYAWLRPTPWLQLATLLLLTVQVHLMFQWVNNAYLEEHPLFPPPGSEAVLRAIREADGPVLTDEYMGLLPLAGKQVYFQPFIFTQLSRSGLWEQQPILDALERQAFETVIIFRPVEWLVHDRWTDEMLDAIEQRYQPASSVGPTIIYEPRGQ